MLETLDYTIRIGSTSTFLYLDLYVFNRYIMELGNVMVNYLLLKLYMYTKLEYHTVYYNIFFFFFEGIRYGRSSCINRLFA